MILQALQGAICGIRVPSVGRGLQYCNSSNEPHGILIPQPLRENVAISRFCWQPRIRILSNLQIEASSIVILRKEPGRYSDSSDLRDRWPWYYDSAGTPRGRLRYSGSIANSDGILILQRLREDKCGTEILLADSILDEGAAGIVIFQEKAGQYRNSALISREGLRYSRPLGQLGE
ncbi:hypothetical protein MPER_13243 [Moniliophthora perniciosa FA553]|nr:hypothetical protein MPER_13243 [Moniliophthora perniciosa FA553]